MMALAGRASARRKLGFWRRGAVSLVKPLMIVMSRRTWRGIEHIPSDGPVIIVANHMSHADPLALAHFVYDSGRWPVFLAKASVFAVPVIGPWLRAVDQTPVFRGTVDAAKALDAAVAALRTASASSSTPRAPRPRSPTCGRCGARPARPGCG